MLGNAFGNSTSGLHTTDSDVRNAESADPVNRQTLTLICSDRILTA